MYTPEELNNEGIRQWDLISKDFEGCPILLGNGFSLNFSKSLLYRFLHQNFIENCSEQAKMLFQEFQTTNFELILRNLEISEKVLNSLGSPNDSLTRFRNEIRQGLIDSIRRIHPTPDSINYSFIKTFSNQLKPFKNIYTTNYDLYSYYLILDTNGWFGDYFFGDKGIYFKKFVKPDDLNSNHIYYLHGALFLFDNFIDTLKIRKVGDRWLIDLITEQINKSNYPLFISEGTAESKVKQINANPYLSYCFEQLKSESSDCLIIFGQSLSEQDLHIANLINDKFKKVAISVKTDLHETFGQVKAEKNRIASLFNKAEVVFYEANGIFQFA